MEAERVGGRYPRHQESATLSVLYIRELPSCGRVSGSRSFKSFNALCTKKKSQRVQTALESSTTSIIY